MDIDAIVDAAVAEEAKAVSATNETEPKVATPDVTESEGQTEGEATEEITEKTEAELLAEENRKIKNAISRRDKKLTKVAVERDMWKQKAQEYESRLSTPAPTEEDFEGKPYGDYLKAVARHEAQLNNTEQALEAAKTKATELETELEESARSAIDKSGEIAEKTFPDFRKVIESQAAKSPNGKLEFSQPAWDAIQRSDDGASAIYGIVKDGKFDELNSLPPIEAAMMIKEYEIKAQSLPKIKHVSTAPEPITSARGIASGSKSLESMTGDEIRAWMNS